MHRAYLVAGKVSSFCHEQKIHLVYWAYALRLWFYKWNSKIYPQMNNTIIHIWIVPLIIYK